MDVHPTKNVSIGIDPYPYSHHAHPISILTQPHMKLMEKNEKNGHSGSKNSCLHTWKAPAACPKLGDLNPLYALPAL